MVIFHCYVSSPEGNGMVATYQPMESDLHLLSAPLAAAKLVGGTHSNPPPFFQRKTGLVSSWDPTHYMDNIWLIYG